MTIDMAKLAEWLEDQTPHDHYDLNRGVWLRGWVQPRADKVKALLRLLRDGSYPADAVPSVETLLNDYRNRHGV